MNNFDLTHCNLLPNKVYVKLDMLGSLMLDGVGGKINQVDIVTVDNICL